MHEAPVAKRPLPRISYLLTEDLIEPDPCTRTVRHDGWTPERKRIFLESLAECGVVEDSARAAGMSRKSAYAARNRAEGRAFQLAWDAALMRARGHLCDTLMSRALHGCVSVIVRDGRVWGEHHRFDNRLTLAVMDRLDAKFADQGDENRTARYIADEFEEFLEIACNDREGAAAEFVAGRKSADRYAPSKEARLLNRLDRYRRTGAGLDLEAELAVDEEEPEDEEPFEEDDIGMVAAAWLDAEIREAKATRRERQSDERKRALPLSPSPLSPAPESGVGDDVRGALPLLPLSPLSAPSTPGSAQAATGSGP